MNIPEKHREVAHAWIDGAEIETRDNGSSNPVWHPVENPAWFDYTEYRIKPKPKVKKWRWAIQSTPYFTAEQAYAMGFTQKIDGSMIEADDE